MMTVEKDGGFEIGRVMHMCMTKPFLIDLIRSQHGPELLKDWDMTEDEAIAAIRKDSREVITVGKCDNYDKKGNCQGHESEEACK